MTRRKDLNRSAWAIASLALACSSAHAEGYCNLMPGWEVVTHGNISESVWILGRLQGAADNVYIAISNGTIGKTNVAIALTAQAAGRNLSVYLHTSTYTCANFPSWVAFGEIRHVKIID